MSPPVHAGGVFCAIWFTVRCPGWAQPPDVDAGGSHGKELHRGSHNPISSGLHILKERDASKWCRFLTLHFGCDADEVAKVTFDIVPNRGKESAENLKVDVRAVLGRRFTPADLQ